MASKKDIVNLIYEQCNKSINVYDLKIVIDIIINKCIQDIIDNQIISVGNFGTLTTYNTFNKNKRILYNVNTKKMFEYKGYESVRFHISESFNNLLREKILFLMELKKEAEEKKSLDKSLKRSKS